jgi:hypothetical protein
MNIMANLEGFIDDFNSVHHSNFTVDSIRASFSKQYKLADLKSLGKWHKLNKNNQTIVGKLKKKFAPKEITSVWQLENYNIYYYNKSDPTGKYREAVMVLFGLKQYHRDSPPKELVTAIMNIIKNIDSVDVCLDVNFTPNLKALNGRYMTHRFWKNRNPTNTYYINETGTLMLNKITVYDKAIKNGLEGILWRYEATMSIPNVKVLALPLYEFKEIIAITKDDNVSI